MGTVFFTFRDSNMPLFIDDLRICKKISWKRFNPKYRMLRKKEDMYADKMHWIDFFT